MIRGCDFVLSLLAGCRLGPNALLELASMSVLLPELGEEDPCGVVTDENEEFNRLMVELFDEEGREMYCS